MAMPQEYIDPEIEDEEPEEPEDEGLSDDEVQGIIAQEIDNAVDFIESDIAPDRIKATQYMRGEPFGDEEEGRSQFISRDVADTINSIVPGLMRMFFGPEHVVEYVPTGPEDVEMAEQATDYVSHIFTKDNPGFLIVHSLVKDLLIRKCGVAKYWWDKTIQVSVQDYSGLDIMQLIQLQQDFALESIEAELVAAREHPNGTVDVRLKIKKPKDGVTIRAVPLDEFFINSDATGFGPGEFRTMGHGRDMTISQLVAMGYDPADLEEARGPSDWRDNEERQARMPTTDTRLENPADESQTPIYYAEAYSYVDVDQDGIAELWKFCVAGPGLTILHKEMVDDHPFAEFPCDPEPHVSAIAGQSMADRTMDIQKNKSGIFRATADSLAEAVVPRLVVGPGVNISDVLNTERSSVIRADNVANVVPVKVPFVGADTFPMLAYLDEVRESRTGMSKTSLGLNPESLQNMTALAAANQFDKSHEMQELIARIMAETGFKRLFRGILRLIHQNQRKARMVQLRGKWVEVNPSAYKADMDVTANVAMGGTQREKINTLQGIAQKQEQILMAMGAQNGLVTPKQYYNTLTKITALSGFKATDQFWSDPDMAEPQEPQPDPKAMAELQKAQNEQQKLALQAEEINVKLMLGLAEIQARHKTTVDVASIKASTDILRIGADLKIQRSEAQNAGAREAVNA